MYTGCTIGSDIPTSNRRTKAARSKKRHINEILLYAAKGLCSVFITRKKTSLSLCLGEMVDLNSESCGFASGVQGKKWQDSGRSKVYGDRTYQKCARAAATTSELDKHRY